MREMEGDAYRTGNVMLFRDWEDSYKKGSKLMNENKEKIEEVEEEPVEEEEEEVLEEEEETKEEISEETPLKEWYSNLLHEALLKKFKIKK